MKKFTDDLLSYLKSPAFLVAGLLVCIGFLFVKPLLKKLPVVGDKLPLLIVALTLAFSLGAMPTYAGPVADSSPTMQAVHTQQFATSLSPSFAAIAPGTFQFLDAIAFGTLAGIAALIIVASRTKKFSRGAFGIGATVAVLAGVLFSPVKTQAASYIETRITSLIIRAANTYGASNGFFRAYLPNGTNFVGLKTNGVPELFGGQGLLSGVTASLVCTQAGGIVCTARFVNGILVTTNGTLSTF